MKTMLGAMALVLSIVVSPALAIAEPDFLPDCATVDPQENVVNLACNVYWEARGEDLKSMLSVAILTVNRVEHQSYPGVIHDVVWQPSQFSWTHDEKSDRIPDHVLEVAAWQQSLWVAEMVWMAYMDPHFDIRVGDVDLEHATHYHADYVSPSWARKMVRVGVVGRHIFYCAPRITKCGETS